MPRHRFSKDAGRLIVAAALSALPLAGLVGCDAVDSTTGRADKKVAKELDAVSTGTSGTDADMEATNKQLDTAARDSATASLPSQIRAKSLLADSELRLAEAATDKVSQNDVRLDEIVHQMTLLATQIQRNNASVEALNKLNPDKVQDEIKKRSAEAAGSDDIAEWYKSESMSMESMAASDKGAATIQTQIQSLTDQIKSETDQRTALLEKADKLAEDSGHEMHQKSIDLFVEGSNARKQAGDISVKIEQDTVALNRAKEDLSLHDLQHESAKTGVTRMDDKSKDIADRWTAVQSQVTALNAANAKLLGDTSAEAAGSAAADDKLASTIAGKSAQVVALADANKALRSAAEAHFNSAIAFYKDAVDKAGTFNNELKKKAATMSERPESAMWKAERAVLDPSLFRNMQADAELQKAELFARSAGEAKRRWMLADMLKPILTAAQLKGSPALDDSDNTDAGQLKTAGDSARIGFKSALDLLSSSNESGDASTDTRNSAQVQAVFGQYALSKLEDLTGNAKAAETALEAAKTQLANVPGDVLVPPVPDELEGSSKSTAGTGGGSPGTITMKATTPKDSGPPDKTVSVTSLAGNYLATTRDAAHGVDLKFDYTFSADGSMKGEVTGTAAGKTAKFSVIGHFTVAAGRVVVNLDSLADGKPLPAGVDKSTPMTAHESGELLTVDGDGTEFIRQ